MTKKWYQSKTIWGILIAALGAFISQQLQVPDISLPENADFNQLKGYLDAVKASNGNPNIIIANIISLLGTGFAIYGRINAGDKIGK